MSRINDKVQGLEVYSWPEFKALLRRLGVPADLPTTCITLVIPVEGVVKVHHDYVARHDDSQWEAPSDQIARAEMEERRDQNL